MVQDTTRSIADMTLHEGGEARILIIEAPYYRDVTEEIIAGAAAVLSKQKVGYDRVAVPGALEIPQVFAQAAAKGLFGGAGKSAKYRGAIIAGCVIRGETSHYDIVCNSTNHWVMETAIAHNIPLGNALLTVDTKEQALARARGGEAGKGGDAARACLRLIWTGTQFENQCL